MRASPSSLRTSPLVIASEARQSRALRPCRIASPLTATVLPPPRNDEHAAHSQHNAS
ncbi:MAG: hypothetical protein LBT00_10510 [Spirochaetaceae bacterium]|nr:hypothetical protein [Spirochaetaceae bacterium]